MIGCDVLMEKKDLRKIVYCTRKMRSERRHERKGNRGGENISIACVSFR